MRAFTLLFCAVCCLPAGAHAEKTENIWPEVESAASRLLFVSVSSPSARSYQTMSDGIYFAKNIELREIVAHAYDVSRDRVIAEQHIARSRFDFTITVPPYSRERYLPLFQQAVEMSLALRVKKVRRLMDVLVATCSSPGPGLTPSPPLKPNRRYQTGGQLRIDSGTLSVLWEELHDLTGKIVLNETKLPANRAAFYDVAVNLDPSHPEGYRAAIEKQLGIVLTPARRSVEVLVVERDPKAVRSQ